LSDRLPSRQRALRILEEAGCSRDVVNHCKAVARLAVKTAEAFQSRGFNVDIGLVEIGALLHDVGRSQSHEVDHVVIGSNIAQSLGLPAQLVSMIKRHAGGGKTPEEAKQLGWPVKSYLPQTLEEKIVSYADKLIEGTRRVPIRRTIRTFSKKLGESHQAIERVKRLYEEMSQLIGDHHARSYAT